jgi:tetratricopeptide (TPR) repeat protein
MAGDSALIEKLALARLEAAARDYLREHKPLDALECHERALVLRKRLYGLQSDEFWAPARGVGELCNQLALAFMQKEDYAQVDRLLRRAEALTQKDPAGRAVTYNNWACYMRQVGKLHSALANLRRALALEQRCARVAAPADTHINLCTVLSQLHKHSEALEHARLALELVSTEVFGGAAAKVAEGPGGVMAAVALSPPDRIAVLCIAYHNFGVENEFCKEFTAALKAYTKGAEIAKGFLGEQHSITALIKASQVAAAKTITAERKRLKAEEDAKAAAAEAAAAARAKAAMEASAAAGSKGGKE